MKQQQNTVRVRVTLEPALEKISALWTEEKALRMACVFDRWARQLRMKVQFARADRNPPRRPPLRPLPRRRLVQN
jgi:hypothetical protein